MLKVNVYSLANLIAGRKSVKEFIQEECTPSLLAEEMQKLLIYDNIVMKKEFENIHTSMQCNSDELACKAVFKVIANHFKDDTIIQQIANAKGEGIVVDSSSPLPKANVEEVKVKTEESTEPLKPSEE